MPQTKRIQPLWKYFKFWMEGVSRGCREVLKNFPQIEYFEAKVEGEKIREKIKNLGITEEDVKEAIKWAREKRNF